MMRLTCRVQLRSHLNKVAPQAPPSMPGSVSCNPGLASNRKMHENSAEPRAIAQSIGLRPIVRAEVLHEQRKLGFGNVRGEGPRDIHCRLPHEVGRFRHAEAANDVIGRRVV